MKGLLFFLIILLISCQNQTKELENHKDQLTTKKNTIILGSPMPETFYQFKKFDGERIYSGTASCILDTTFSDLYPSATVANDSLRRLMMVLYQIDKKSANIIGKILFSNIPYKIGKFHTSDRILFDYYQCIENGCVSDSYYKTNDSIPEKSYLIINYIDTDKKIIHGEFELHLKLSDSTTNFNKKQKYMVIRNGKFKTRFYYEF